MTVERDPLAEVVIGRAIKVHRRLGPGLLESTYEACLCYELREQGLAYERQKQIPIVYGGVRIDCGFRVDLIVEGALLVEIKSVAQMLPVYDAQIITYLRLSGLRHGLLLNFNSTNLTGAMKSFLNDRPRSASEAAPFSARSTPEPP